MFKDHELIIGVSLFIFSLLISLTFVNSFGFLAAVALWWNWVAIIIILDFLSRKFIKKSYIKTKNKTRLFKIIVVAIIFGLILDLFGALFTKLWVYPYFPLSIYLFLAPFGYVAYSIILLGLYELIKKSTGGKKKYDNIPNFYFSFIYCELILGIGLGILAVIETSKILTIQKINFLDITKMETTIVPWWYVFAILTSIFFIFEFICFKEKKNTFTKDVLNLNLHPLIAIIIANIIAIAFIEFINAPIGIWKFGNWIHNDIQILTVPIAALIAWPLQFFAFLSMLRAVLSNKELEIW